MLWLLKRTVSLRRFFGDPTACVVRGIRKPIFNHTLYQNLSLCEGSFCGIPWLLAPALCNRFLQFKNKPLIFNIQICIKSTHRIPYFCIFFNGFHKVKFLNLPKFSISIFNHQNWFKIPVYLNKRNVHFSTYSCVLSNHVSAEYYIEL